MSSVQRRWVIRGVVAIIIGSLAVLEINFWRVRAADHECQSNVQCKTSGYCHAESGSWRLVPADTKFVSCIAASDDDCKAANCCQDVGWCTAREGKCVAGRDEDCRNTSQCRELGHCHPVNGICAATDDADCKRTA